MYRINLLALVVSVVSVSAFVTPVPSTSSQTVVDSTTSLNFKFLKDMGLEKPSWLPDFGGEKKEDEPAADAAAGSEDEAAEEAVAEEN